jgi:hypothetical protein
LVTIFLSQIDSRCATNSVIVLVEKAVKFALQGGDLHPRRHTSIALAELVVGVQREVGDEQHGERQQSAEAGLHRSRDDNDEADGDKQRAGRMGAGKRRTPAGCPAGVCFLLHPIARNPDLSWPAIPGEMPARSYGRGIAMIVRFTNVAVLALHRYFAVNVWLPSVRPVTKKVALVCADELLAADVNMSDVASNVALTMATASV